MRIMAIDYGDARTGVAVSDISCTLVGDTFVLRETSLNKLAAALAGEAEKRGVSCIVVGHPKNMNGSVGPRAEKSQALAAKLGALCPVAIKLWDERLTSVAAHRILHESGKHGKKNKDLVDAVAATLILEGYLMSGQSIT